MAKIYGLFGSMTGKLADTVMSVRNGEQIARKYQPVVFNPSTPAQVEQRAKLKLLSQLSAVVAPVIAIPRQGAVSSRNRFTKVNFPKVTYADLHADIDLVDIKLTASAVGLPSVTATRSEGNLAVALSSASGLGLSRMVYIIIERESDEKLRLIGSQVVSADAENPTFSATIEAPAGALSVLAYGVRDNNENARAVFGDLTSPSASTVAKIIVTRTLLESDITLTETRGAFVNPLSREADVENSTTKKAVKK